MRIQRTSKKPKVDRSTPVLDKLKLERGALVRFRRHGEQWIQGVITGDNKDGSLQMQAGGMARAAMPEECQLKTQGKRGGTVWKDLVENE